MGSWATCQQAHLRCRHRSKIARMQYTSHNSPRPLSHHPRCPSRLGTGSQAHLHHQHQQLLLLLYPRHHHLPLLQHPSIQAWAAQTLAAASRTARGAPASNPSSGTFGRSNFAGGSRRILTARLDVCSRRRPCCGGCTGSTSRGYGEMALVIQTQRRHRCLPFSNTGVSNPFHNHGYVIRCTVLPQGNLNFDF